MRKREILLLLFLPIFVGCSTGKPNPDLGTLYNRAAREHYANRNPVVVVPGILGTKLKDSETGKVVWGSFTGEAIDPETSEGTALMAHPVDPGTPIHQLKDSVKPDGVLEQIRTELFGLPISLQAYVPILRTLGIAGFRDRDLGWMGPVDYGDRHFTCFQFGYDWRRSISEGARKFHAFIRKQKEYVASERKKRYGTTGEDVQFNVIAHSMGALLVRYYLRYGDQKLPADGSLPELTWEGAKHVDRVFLISPPNRGTVKSLFRLVRGYDTPITMPNYSPALIGTMPSLYQVLPPEGSKALQMEGKEQPAKLYSVKFWEKLGWGLLDPEEERVRKTLFAGMDAREERMAAARDHVRKCLRKAKQFHRAMSRDASPPEGVRLYLFTGDATSTPSRVVVSPGSGSLNVVHRLPGDGTITRRSALMDMRSEEQWTPKVQTPISWDRIQFLSEEHMDITRSEEFMNNLLYYILEAPEISR